MIDRKLLQNRQSVQFGFDKDRMETIRHCMHSKPKKAMFAQNFPKDASL